MVNHDIRNKWTCEKHSIFSVKSGLLKNSIFSKFPTMLWGGLQITAVDLIYKESGSPQIKINACR